MIAPDKKKLVVLGIAPHPDDLEIGCGGTLLKLARSGHEIHLMVMTKGEVGGNTETRVKEQIAAAKHLNAKSLTWGGFNDTKIPLSKESIDSLEAVIKRVRPDLVFAPWGDDTHQDHRHTSAQVRSATRSTQNVLFYEVPSTVDFLPDAYFDIESVLKDKYHLLQTHRSQLSKTKPGELSIIDCARSMAHFRGYQGRLKAAEGFKIFRLRLEF